MRANERRDDLLVLRLGALGAVSGVLEIVEGTNSSKEAQLIPGLRSPQ